jgi:hypothetical protein
MGRESHAGFIFQLDGREQCVCPLGTHKMRIYSNLSFCTQEVVQSGRTTPNKADVSSSNPLPPAREIHVESFP